MTSTTIATFSSSLRERENFFLKQYLSLLTEITETNEHTVPAVSSMYTISEYLFIIRKLFCMNQQ